jgi:hypothetical protein
MKNSRESKFCTDKKSCLIEVLRQNSIVFDVCAFGVDFDVL